jgi:hypothetical protein
MRAFSPRRSGTRLVRFLFDPRRLSTLPRIALTIDAVLVGHALERGPVLGSQVNDGDPVGFGLAEVIVKPGFRPSGLIALGGEGANDSGLVEFLDNTGGGLLVSWFGKVIRSRQTA